MKNISIRPMKWWSITKLFSHFWWSVNGSLTRYVQLWVAHAPGMLGTFSWPPRVSEPDMHHGTCVAHVPCCMLGSLTNGFLWSMWRGNVPGACATRNFTYLVRGRWHPWGLVDVLYKGPVAFPCLCYFHNAIPYLIAFTLFWIISCDHLRQTCKQLCFDVCRRWPGVVCSYSE